MDIYFLFFKFKKCSRILVRGDGNFRATGFLNIVVLAGHKSFLNPLDELQWLRLDTSFVLALGAMTLAPGALCCVFIIWGLLIGGNRLLTFGQLPNGTSWIWCCGSRFAMKFIFSMSMLNNKYELTELFVLHSITSSKILEIVISPTPFLTLKMTESAKIQWRHRSWCSANSIYLRQLFFLRFPFLSWVGSRPRNYIVCLLQWAACSTWPLTCSKIRLFLEVLFVHSCKSVCTLKLREWKCFHGFSTCFLSWTMIILTLEHDCYCLTAVEEEWIQMSCPSSKLSL